MRDEEMKVEAIQDAMLSSFILHPHPYIGPGSSRGPRLPPSSNAPSGEGAAPLPLLPSPPLFVAETFSFSSRSLRVSSLVASDLGSLLSVRLIAPGGDC